MPDFYQTPKFQLPDNLTVNEVACVCVHIPDDPQYYSQLIGHLDALKWSKNFADDPTKLGAGLVSRSWQRALESEAIRMSCGIVLRQSTTNPCLLEQSDDGGVTWSTAFNYSLCSNNITVPAPYPGSPTGASDAAAQAVRTILIGLLTMVPDICALSRSQYIEQSTAMMRLYDPSYANPAALGQIYDAWCALDPEEQEEQSSECNFLDEKTDMQNCANSDGLFDWLNCLNARIMEWLNEANTDLMNALMAAAAALSGNGWQNASAGGEGGGAGFGDTCNWIAEFDLTASSPIWSFVQSCSQNTGQWVTGTGLLSVDGYAAENCAVPKNRLIVRAQTVNSFTLSRMIAWIVPASPPNGYEQYLGAIIGGDNLAYQIFSAPFGSASPVDVSITPSACYGIQMAVDHSDNVLGEDAGFSKVRVYGSGAIPAEYAPYII